MTNEITRRGSIPNAMAWMFGLSLALFWMPVAGPLIAGFVGGRKAGSAGRAIAAALLPGAVLFVLMVVVGGLLGWIPIIGQLFAFLLGTGAKILSIVNVVPLLVGAVIGGATSD